MPEIVQCTCSEEWNGPTLNLDHARDCPWAAIEDAEEAELDELRRVKAERDRYREALEAAYREAGVGTLDSVRYVIRQFTPEVAREALSGGSDDG